MGSGASVALEGALFNESGTRRMAALEGGGAQATTLTDEEAQEVYVARQHRVNRNRLDYDHLSHRHRNCAHH